MADRPMHIAIDGRELAGRPTGVGRYLLEIMRRWAGRPACRFTVIVHAEPAAALQALGPSFCWHVEPAEAAGTLWEQMRLPRALRRLRPDVLFAPGYTAPLLSPVPFVLAVYDVSFCAHPEWFRWREGLRRRWITRAAARRARAVATISQFSAGEIQWHLGVPASRIVLAPPGPPAVEDRPPGGRQRLVLFAGSLFTRRHVPEMIAAFASVAASVPDARFVLVGDNRSDPPVDPRRIAADLGVADRVDWREYVTDAELEALYGSARVFLFLSDYEGFAMTPLEALAHGVPSVIADTDVSREIYGDAAIRVRPEPAAIAAAVTALLTDDAAHAALVAAGRVRLGAYSWDRSAETILRCLREAVR